MEFDPRTDRLPFNQLVEAEPARAGATESSSDARIRHLQRVPLFSGFNENELRRTAELARIVDVPAGSPVTQIGEPGESFFVIIDGTVAVRTPVGTGAVTPGGVFWGDEPARWRASFSDDRGDDGSSAVGRRSFSLLGLLDETPDLIRRMLTILSRRVRRLEQTVHAVLHGANPT